MFEKVESILSASLIFKILIEFLLPIVIFIACWVIIIYLPKICWALEDKNKN